MTYDFTRPDLPWSISNTIPVSFSRSRELAPTSTWRMASPAVVQTGLYARALAARGLQFVIPDAAGQQDIHNVIFAIKAGDKSTPVRKKLLRICRQLMDLGSDALILGCTELPLLASPADFPVPAIDTLEELALAAIQAARSPQPIEII